MKRDKIFNKDYEGTIEEDINYIIQPKHYSYSGDLGQDFMFFHNNHYHTQDDIIPESVRIDAENDERIEDIRNELIEAGFDPIWITLYLTFYLTPITAKQLSERTGKKVSSLYHNFNILTTYIVGKYNIDRAKYLNTIKNKRKRKK